MASIWDKWVEEVLGEHVGEGAALTTSELCIEISRRRHDTSELRRRPRTSERGVRKAIAALQRAGHLICADDRGWYVAATWEEYRRYHRRNLSRGRHVFARLAPQSRAAYEAFSGQMTVSEREAAEAELDSLVAVLGEGDDGEA
jgi:hypothetical protein